MDLNDFNPHELVQFALNNKGELAQLWAFWGVVTAAAGRLKVGRLKAAYTSLIDLVIHVKRETRRLRRR